METPWIDLASSRFTKSWSCHTKSEKPAIPRSEAFTFFGLSWVDREEDAEDLADDPLRFSVISLKPSVCCGKASDDKLGVRGELCRGSVSSKCGQRDLIMSSMLLQFSQLRHEVTRTSTNMAAVESTLSR